MSSGARSASGGDETDYLRAGDDLQNRAKPLRDRRRPPQPQKESMGERRTRLLGQLDELLATVDVALDETRRTSGFDRLVGTP